MRKMIFLGLLLLPLTSLAASFDCARARSYAEKTICSDPQLSDLDEQLLPVYQRARALARDKVAFKRQTEAAWKWREVNCKTRQCVADWYAERFVSLDAAAALGYAPHPEPGLPPELRSDLDEPERRQGSEVRGERWESTPDREPPMMVPLPPAVTRNPPVVIKPDAPRAPVVTRTPPVVVKADPPPAPVVTRTPPVVEKSEPASAPPVVKVPPPVIKSEPPLVKSEPPAVKSVADPRANANAMLCAKGNNVLKTAFENRLKGVPKQKMIAQATAQGGKSPEFYTSLVDLAYDWGEADTYKTTNTFLASCKRKFNLK